MTVTVKTVLLSRSMETSAEAATLELEYPRNIHSEFMTHRKFGRNASSSRAIPMKRMHTRIMEDPALPEKWTLNEPGMQGYTEASPEVIEQAKRVIERHRLQSIGVAEELAALGFHKQIYNRYTEAHQHIKVVVTASDWDNFLMLRTHETAEPTMQVLATKIGDALSEARVGAQMLERGEWHLPYFDQEDAEALNDFLDGHGIPTDIWQNFPPYAGYRAQKRALSIAVSAARCARTSYNNFAGQRSGVVEDIELFRKLIVAQPIHSSPLEHQCTPDWIQHPFRNIAQWANPEQHGNLEGWRQARKFIPGESGSYRFSGVQF